MKIWNQSPLVRLLIPFVMGAAIPVLHHDKLLLLIIPLFFLMSFTVLVPAFSIPYKYSWCFGVLVYPCLFISAAQLSKHTIPAAVADSSSFYVVRIQQSIVEKEKSYKTVAEIISFRSGTHWEPYREKLLVYFAKDSHSAVLHYGDEILLKADLREITGPQNPGEFDHRSFLRNKKIYRQAYIASRQWTALGKNSGNKIIAACIQLRDDLLLILKTNGVEGKEFGVGSALMLGYTDQLDPEVLANYAGTGALHVLSVSGLHVAIVYVVFNWLLFFFDRFKRGAIPKAVILIFLLWAYAALTGLSPSVLRAATMFSFVIAGKAFGRHTNIYNTLAASAFLLLMIDPHLLADVGFQLSYIAVIGIVYLQPRIHSLLEPSSWITEQLWTITSVSLAAQLATFPLGLFYFHQFPNYFLISNFAVIPLSTAVIYLGIALFAFAKLPLIAKGLGWLFSWSVALLNGSVKWIAEWPGAVLQGVFITPLELVILYGGIISMLLFSEFRRFNFLCASLFTLIILLGLQIYEQYVQDHQHKIIVYNIKGKSAVDLISGRQNILYSKDTIEKKSLEFSLRQSWQQCGIRRSALCFSDTVSNDFRVDTDLLGINDKVILMIRTNVKLNSKINPDYIILSGRAPVPVAEIGKKFPDVMLIIDSSVQPAKRRELRKECLALGLRFHDVCESGAYTSSF
jgi:competence protein ComEC